MVYGSKQHNLVTALFSCIFCQQESLVLVKMQTSLLQAAEKFKAPQPTSVIPEAKAAAIEHEEESEEEEVQKT